MGWAFEPKVIATRNPPFEVLVVVQGTPCLRVTATVVYNKLFFKWGNKDSFTLLLRERDMILIARTCSRRAHSNSEK
jgi:hypothetical protein